MTFTTLSAAELARRYRAGEARPTEVVGAALAAIEARDPAIGAFVHVRREAALAEAAGIEAAFAAGRPLHPLAGVPVAVKDNLHLAGEPTTCGSRMLAGYRPPFTATAVARLRAAGAVVVGKTNLDEFAMGSSTENSALFPTRNPHDRERVPGGSSGGSAAAVAAGFVPLALGSDTGGSIRQPASFCGVVGLKPTYGRVSRYGLVAFASSLDQIGPLANTVRDAAELLGCIAGADPLDSTTSDAGVEDWAGQLDAPAAGLRLGIPREYFIEGLDPQVKARVEQGVAALEKLGCAVEEVSLPHTEYAVAAYYLIATAEASSNLARYDGVRFGLRAEAESLRDMYRRTRMQGFGGEVKRRILLGTYALSAGYYDAYYLKAQKVRTLILRDFQEAFRKVDLIVTPTTPTPAFKLGEKTGDPLSMYLSDIFTITCNLAGLPGVSLPCGAVYGLPVGLQLLGPHFEEGRILRLAHHFERAGGFRL